MFIQVIRGKVTDADALREMTDRWQKEVGPGATGFLGATSGVTDDGTAVSVVRFESPETAQRNSDRAEQAAWWNEMSKLYDGEPTFYNCPTVDVGLGGGSDQAGFIQVMISKISDVGAARKLGKQFESMAPQMRPDVIGYTDAYTDDGICVTTTYFTSEAAAREGETQDLAPEHQALFEQYHQTIADTEYYDLRNPWYAST